MKKFISFLLSFVILLMSMSPLCSCSNNRNYISMGRWLELLNNSFGMFSSKDEEPHFNNLKKGDAYFEAAQISSEWGIVDGQSIDVNKYLTWQEAVETLVNAGSFIKSDSTSDEKLEYGFSNFGKDIRKYWKSRNIRYDDAVVLLGNAQELWSEKTYDVPVEEVDYKENVKDYTKLENKPDYKTVDNTVILPDDGTFDLKPGDVYLLPAENNAPGVRSFMVESITKSDGNLVITNSQKELELEDIAENLFVQETIIPSADNAIIYDGNGNKLSNDMSSVKNQNNSNSNNSSQLNYLMNDTDGDLENLSKKIKTEFTVDGWNIGLSYSLGDSFGFDATIGKGEDDKGKWEVCIGVEDLKVTNEVDYKWFKLNSASVKVDYDTKLNFGAKFKSKPVDTVCAPYNNGNGKGWTNIKKAAFKKSKNAGGEGAQTVKIMSIDLWSLVALRLCLDVKFVVEVDGTFSLNITTHNCKGVEYKNNNIRYINTHDTDTDLKAEAKIEATLCIGPAIYTFGLKKALIGAEVKAGAGATASITLHLVDSDEHLIEKITEYDSPPRDYEVLANADIPTDADSIIRAAEAQGVKSYQFESTGALKLHTDICFDIAFYAIVRISLSASYATDLLDGKIKISHEFLGKNNATFACAHVENFDFVNGFKNIKFCSEALSADLCTKKYKKFEGATDDEIDEETSEDQASGNDTILKGDQIVPSEIRANILIGQTYYPILQSIPKGYELSDINVKVHNTKIAKVNDDGSITGLSEGSTIIEYYTKGNDYSAYCALNVSTEKKVEFTKLT